MKTMMQWRVSFLAMMVVGIGGLMGCSQPTVEDEVPTEQSMEEGDEWTDAMEEEHRGEEPRANEATQGVVVEGVTSSEVAYHQGAEGDVEGYLVVPEGVEPQAGVVIIHEWWGLNENIRSMAEQLAMEGYAVLAVDLYEGSVASTSEEAQGLMRAANQRRGALIENIASGLGYLEGEFGFEKMGILGWCFGGGYSFYGAEALGDQVDAAVVYYGHVPTEVEAMEGLTAPVLGIFGGQDAGIPLEQVRGFQAAMEEAGKELNLQVFPEAEHAFANPSGERYDAEAARAAWMMTLQFLGEHL